ncbi:MAG: glycosyltransferase [Rhodobacteraceae bacterium]|jgi:GT2 family glycosyltransferase|nr:glycosyltransferase [Paracoccaceae bacterium]
MTGQDMRVRSVAVAIVNYGTADLALTAAESVLAMGHEGRRVTVHLVDNASPGGDGAALAAAIAARGWEGRVTLYRETVNHGFGRANNLVFRALADRPDVPDAVFLLNPDARLENEAIAELSRFLETHPCAGCAGARICKPGDVPVTAAFRFPSAASEFADTLAFGPVARLFARSTVSLPPDTPTGPVGWVSGAAVMFRWTALAEVGGFDPDFFLYFEEVELMRRITAKGWQVWHVAEARVVHAEGMATGVRSGDVRPRPMPDYWYDSWYLYFTKVHAPAYSRLCAVARVSAWTLNGVISGLRGREPNAPPRWLDGFSRRVLRPMIGLAATGSRP